MADTKDIRETKPQEPQEPRWQAVQCGVLFAPRIRRIQALCAQLVEQLRAGEK